MPIVSNRVAIEEMRRENPRIKAITMACELGISRERVRQILVDLGLPTRIPNITQRRQRKWKYRRERAYSTTPDSLIRASWATMRLAQDVMFSMSHENN